MNKISFHDTHVYPGCTAIIFFVTVPNSTVPAIAEFSDGAMATAEIEQTDPDEVFIHLDAYTTARNTRIGEKTWRLRHDNARDIWKVVAKI